MVQTQTLNLANIGEEIGVELGAQFISSYRQNNATDVTSYLVGRSILDQVLAQPGCAGIRFYNAYNEVGAKTLVYVGVNADGNDMLNVTSINTNGQLAVQNGIVADRIRTEDDPIIVTPTWWEF